jgi:hypothetical protein
VGAIVNEVGDDDRRREEEQTEDEVADEAKPFSAMRSTLASWSGYRRPGAILDEVGNDERRREEEEAEYEVPEETVSLAAGDTGWPECDRDPNGDEQDEQDPPQDVHDSFSPRLFRDAC